MDARHQRNTACCEQVSLPVMTGDHLHLLPKGSMPTALQTNMMMPSAPCSIALDRAPLSEMVFHTRLAPASTLLPLHTPPGRRGPCWRCCTEHLPARRFPAARTGCWPASPWRTASPLRRSSTACRTCRWGGTGRTARAGGLPTLWSRRHDERQGGGSCSA